MEKLFCRWADWLAIFDLFNLHVGTLVMSLTQIDSVLFMPEKNFYIFEYSYPLVSQQGYGGRSSQSPVLSKVRRSSPQWSESSQSSTESMSSTCSGCCYFSKVIFMFC